MSNTINYARDTRSEAKMLEDFKVGKENETLAIELLKKELIWKGENIQGVDCQLNEVDSPGEFRTYSPDAELTLHMYDSRSLRLNVEVKATGFKLLDPIFIKAGQVYYLKQHPNPYFLIADVEKFIFKPVDELLAGIEPEPVERMGGKEFYLIPHNKLFFNTWTYGATFKRPEKNIHGNLSRM